MIDNPTISKVFFGTAQIIIEVNESKYYYLGLNDRHQGCQNSDENIFEPHLINISTPYKLKANEYRMVVLTKDNEL